ncbi:MAG: single-stranded-DNA-specific exonuclease RecJ [Desulfobacterales bacterium]|nr:single-stranded-DNA-specific exonuclease RecJ [Deltaproteobacteria bacterium]NNK95504.1 single-stranded-DNA-specific exonuclease RecJ [Desulfobacterales bacterium]
MTVSTDQPTIHPIIREHLSLQGLLENGVLDNYLYPTLAELPSPFLLKSMDKAVDLVIESIQAGSEIIIWGDYDVDGITSTALLILFFRQLGVEVRYYVPDRLTEGYGLNGLKLSQISEKKDQKKLLITVDCGISDHQEIALAQAHGFQVIVTDHHNVPHNTVGAEAVINPKQTGCCFPYKHLAGVGVAFYLAIGIRAHLCNIKHSKTIDYRPNLKSFLGLVALGTVADVMPLDGVNRILVKGGLEAIAGGDCLGLGVLLDEIGVNKAQLASEAISFQVAPVVNAAGRMGAPLVALEALIHEGSDERSKSLAQKLVSLNKKRKKVGKSDLENALNIVSKYMLNDAKSIVICGDFHDGVIGITASRLSELYGVPAIVCCNNSKDKLTLKGSGRGPVHFDLYAAIRSCEHYLEKYGGHEVAAGITIKREVFNDFAKEFERQAAMQLSDLNKQKMTCDNNFLDLSLSTALNSALLTNLWQLEPVGVGNPKPIFRDTQACLTDIHLFGARQEHLRGVIRGTYSNVKVVGFNIGERAHRIRPGETCTIIYSHMFDNYGGRSQWKIRIEDIWQHDQDQ